MGMLVDISHVNNYTMNDVLDTSLAPGINIKTNFQHTANLSLSLYSNIQSFFCLCTM